MGVKFKNNAVSELSTAISASDVGLAVTFGDGTLFPAAGSGDYYYMTIVATDGTYEVVKVTARSGDSMTVTRAQEGTSAVAFSAGALCELRITNQGILDKVAEDNLAAGSVALSKLADMTTQRLLGRKTAGTGAVEQITAVEALEFISATQGVLLYRGAGAWAALGVGTAGQVLQSGGAGANPAWATSVGLTDGDKGDITVSSTGTVFTIDNNVVSYAKMQDVSGQYRLLGRSSSGSGDTEEIASSANVFTLLGAADYTTFRSSLGLGSLALQASSSASVTGGSITGLDTLQGTMKVATNTTGTLALADANTFCPMTGNVTINGGVFSARQAILFYSGASARTITQGSSMTLRLGGSSSTGTRSVAAYSLAVAVVIDANTVVISGTGVT